MGSLEACMVDVLSSDEEGFIDNVVLLEDSSASPPPSHWMHSSLDKDDASSLPSHWMHSSFDKDVASPPPSHWMHSSLDNDDALPLPSHWMHSSLDKDDDDNDDVIILEELSWQPKRRGSEDVFTEAAAPPVKKARIDDDDECCILDCSPDEILFSPGKAGSSSISDVEDVVVIGEKGAVACRDYPHARHLCAKFPFEDTDHEKFCDKCHCFVCDKLAPCLYWGNGRQANDHCHASEKDPKWKRTRCHSWLRPSAKSSLQDWSLPAPPVYMPSPVSVSVSNYFVASPWVDTMSTVAEAAPPYSRNTDSFGSYSSFVPAARSPPMAFSPYSLPDSQRGFTPPPLNPVVSAGWIDQLDPTLPRNPNIDLLLSHVNYPPTTAWDPS